MKEVLRVMRYILRMMLVGGEECTWRVEGLTFLKPSAKDRLTQNVAKKDVVMPRNPKARMRPQGRRQAECPSHAVTGYRRANRKL
jgi:hypothetical protein